MGPWGLLILVSFSFQPMCLERFGSSFISLDASQEPRIAGAFFLDISQLILEIVLRA